MPILGKVVIMKIWFLVFGLALLLQLSVNVFWPLSLVVNCLVFFILLGVTNVVCVFIKRTKYERTQAFKTW